MTDSLDVCAHCGDSRDCDYRCDDDWKQHAECDGMDESVFFPRKPGDNGGIDYRLGKLVCTRCPVMAQCRAYAERNREEWGIWGGLKAKEILTLRYVERATVRTCTWCLAYFVSSSKARKHCCEGCKKAQKEAKKGPFGTLKRGQKGPPGACFFLPPKRRTPPPSQKTLPKRARLG